MLTAWSRWSVSLSPSPHEARDVAKITGPPCRQWPGSGFLHSQLWVEGTLPLRDVWEIMSSQDTPWMEQVCITHSELLAIPF